MTREEAKKEIEKVFVPEYANYIITALTEGATVSDKAPEQQPCEDKIIEWKRDFKEYVNSLSMPRDDYKGIMEYIDELPITPQEPCEDAISRKWLVETLEAKGFNLTDTDYNIMIHLIRDTAPSVYPKPKTGHWIERPNCYECSECGIIRAKETSGKYNYCPNCGADMTEVTE